MEHFETDGEGERARQTETDIVVCKEIVKTDKVKETESRRWQSTAEKKKKRSRKARTYCMFPFGSISQGHCGCFLMWFSLFIQHLLDNWSRLLALLPHWQRQKTTSNNKGSEGEEAATLQNTTHSNWSESLLVQQGIHEDARLVLGCCCHLAQLNTAFICTFSKSTHKRASPPCLFSCCLIVDNEIKLNRVKSSNATEQPCTCRVSNVINFLPATADTQYGSYMRLLTCQNQTMANVSPARITFTIGCWL